MTEAQAEESTLLAYEPQLYQAPRVNLLPPEIGDRLKLRKLQAGLGGLAIVAAGAVALLYVQAGSGQSDAQARLDAARAVQPGLQAQAAKLAHVSAEKAAVDSARASLKVAMGSEVLWSSVLDNFRRYLPDGVRMSSLATTDLSPTTAAGTATAPNATAVTTPSNVIATVLISGKAVDLNAVAAELDDLAKIPGLSNVVLTTTSKAAAPTAGQPALAEFTATANVTNAVLSHRYDDTGASQ